MLVFESHASDGPITCRLIAFCVSAIATERLDSGRPVVGIGRTTKEEERRHLWEPLEMHVPMGGLNIICMPLSARLETRAPKIREASTKVSRGGSAKPLLSKHDWQVTYGLAQQSYTHREEKRLSQT